MVFLTRFALYVCIKFLQKLIFFLLLGLLLFLLEFFIYFHWQTAFKMKKNIYKETGTTTRKSSPFV